MPLKYRKANLKKAPQSIKRRRGAHISVGDLHGNALKLIYILMEERLLVFRQKKHQYEALKEIYQMPVENLNATHLAKFEDLLSQAIIRPNHPLTLIGDELCDRGNNDYFTLLVFKRLCQGQVDFDIMLSNHGAEFIKDTERQQMTGRCMLLEGQGQSLSNLYYLIQAGLVSETGVTDLAETYYKPKIKAIAYTVSKRGVVSLYTHAPIGLETVRALARRFCVHYSDRTIQSLLRTIDDINTNLQLRLVKGRLRRVLRHEQFDYDTKKPIPLSMPLSRLIWNRRLGKEFVQKPKGNFRIKFIHGHIGNRILAHPTLKRVTSHQNLDNLFGKDENRLTTNRHICHFTRETRDRTSKQLSDDFFESISQLRRRKREKTGAASSTESSLQWEEQIGSRNLGPLG